MLNRKFTKHHWDGVKPDPENSFGFVYTITSIKTFKVYVGRKQYHRRRRRKDGSYSYLSNRWEFYEGSSKYLKEDIEKIGKEYFIFTIVENYKTSEDLDKAEKELLTTLDVLKRQSIFYNKNIGGELFTSSFANICRSNKDISGKNNPMFGKTHSDEAKRKIGEASRKRSISEETREKMRIASLNNKKVYKFTHKNGHTFVGTCQQIVESFSNVAICGIKELIRGRTYDKTCLSGYANVVSRYGWVKAEYIGVFKDLKELKELYG